MAAERFPRRAFLLRLLGYVLFWVVLAGFGLKDLLFGVVTAAAAAWMSLVLLPPGELTFQPIPALRLFWRFLGQSVVAGVTVARLALSPRMALRPGLIAYPSALPAGNRRWAFMTFASLLPGSLPIGSGEDGAITVHVLDHAVSAAQALQAEERRFAAALAEQPRS